MEYFVYVHEPGAYKSLGTPKGRVSSIKEGTFHFNTSNGHAGKYKFGNVCSSYCEFDYYGGGSVTIQIGDVFYWEYYTNYDESFNDLTGSASATDHNNDGNVIIIGITAVDDGNANITTSGFSVTDNGNGDVTISNSSNRLINSRPRVFYVVSVKKNKNLYHVIGCDAVYYLNKDYSQRLAQIQSNFPMTINELLADVCDYCGIRMSNLGETDWLSYAQINAFYVEGITGRDIVRYIADACAVDISTSYVYTHGVWTSNCIIGTRDVAGPGLGQGGWYDADTYIICPDDGTYYQEDGVTQAVNVWYKENSLNINSIETAYDGVEYVSSKGVSLGHYYSTPSPQSIYYITQNIIIDNIIQSTMLNTFDVCAENLLTPPVGRKGINDVFPYAASTVEIFPFRNPFGAYMSTWLIDNDGNYRKFPLMSVDITDDRVHLEAFGEDVADNTLTSYGSVAKPTPDWIYYTLHDGTYGKLTMVVNRASGVAILRWIGNGTTPPSGTRIDSTIAPYKTTMWGIAAPLRNGDQLVMADSNGAADGYDVSVWLTTANWSNGSLTIPLDQS